MDDFLTKPASLADVYAALRRLVGQPGQAESRTGTAIEPDDLPVFDESRLDALVDEFGDVDLVADLLATFVGDLAGQLAAIRSADGDDAEVVKRVAHTVKGTAAMFGAEVLRTAAAELEHEPGGSIEPFAAAVAAVEEYHADLLRRDAAPGQPERQAEVDPQSKVETEA